jgi:hypothetical protein
VQNDLAELGLVGVLNDMFHKLDWTVAQPRANSRGIHGYGCACNPKSVRVINFSANSHLQFFYKNNKNNYFWLIHGI